ncbi:MAG: hypothetical protein Q9222_001399 [Ikaeria aurantiellina]
MYDDFQELRPGAAEQLESRLNGANPPHRIQAAGANPEERGNHSGLRSRLCALISAITTPWGPEKDSDELPRYQTPQNQSTARTTSMSQPEGLMISDQTLFENLKNEYTDMLGKWMSVCSLKRLASIRFVYFGMYRSELVDVYKYDDMPPEEKKDEYRFSPTPADLIPPIGPNHMMHLFEHPDHAETDGVCLDKIPKKLRDRLQSCPAKGIGLGWAIYFVEGLDWFMIWLLGFAGLLLSLVLGIAWAIRRDDVQGGFGITACMMVGFVFTTGLVQSAFEAR